MPVVSISKGMVSVLIVLYPLMESVQRGDSSIVMKFGTRDAYETAKFELFTNRMYYDADQYLMNAYGTTTWNNKYATDDDFLVITIQWL